MSERLVIYSGSIKVKVDSYNTLDEKDKTGGFWDNESDTELREVKKHIKDHYLKVQDHTCPYCQQKIEVTHGAAWDTEHILPKDKYPQHLLTPLNLCVSCKDCNLSKRNKNILKNPNRKTLPRNSDDYTIIHPHLDLYENHMKRLNSSLFFIPKDDKGKETIEVCGLLRFLYKFTDYGNISLEVKKRIGLLQNDLMNASSPLEENIILDCIADVVEHGKKISKQSYLESLSTA